MESRVCLIRPENFSREVLLETRPVLLVCTVQDDSYARQMKVLENVAQTYEKELKVGLLAQDSTEIFKRKLNIAGTPTLLLMRAGREINRILGVTDLETLIALLDRHLLSEPREV
ncbi:MAG: hypothetical protein EG826_10305 [Deltaproteobacteria bacterium]|nr:hypothetical protein [Deltaproteobacteria bacterium]